MALKAVNYAVCEWVSIWTSGLAFAFVVIQTGEQFDKNLRRWDNCKIWSGPKDDKASFPNIWWVVNQGELLINCDASGVCLCVFFSPDRLIFVFYMLCLVGQGKRWGIPELVGGEREIPCMVKAWLHAYHVGAMVVCLRRVEKEKLFHWDYLYGQRVSSPFQGLCEVVSELIVWYQEVPCLQVFSV